MVFDIKPDGSILCRLHAFVEISHPCEVFDVAELLPLGWGVCSQQELMPMDNGELWEMSQTFRNYVRCRRSCIVELYGHIPLFPLFSGTPDSPHSTSLAQIEVAPKDQKDAKSELLNQDRMMSFYQAGMGGK